MQNLKKLLIGALTAATVASGGAVAAISSAGIADAGPAASTPATHRESAPNDDRGRQQNEAADQRHEAEARGREAEHENEAREVENEARDDEGTDRNDDRSGPSGNSGRFEHFGPGRDGNDRAGED
jgi:hypothetical protein